MRVVDFTVGLGWIAFWIYWIASAAGVKPGQSRWLRFAGFRVGIVVVILLLLRFRFLRGHEAVREPVMWGIGLALFFLGLALAIWARLCLGRNWGMPMSTKDEPELVTAGPYRTIRHPIYTGILLGFIGSAIAVSLYWLVAVVLIGGYFIYSAVVEERNMTRQFPDAYPEYKQSTKMLIPFTL